MWKFCSSLWRLRGHFISNGSEAPCKAIPPQKESLSQKGREKGKKKHLNAAKVFGAAKYNSRAPREPQSLISTARVLQPKPRIHKWQCWSLQISTLNILGERFSLHSGGNAATGGCNRNGQEHYILFCPLVFVMAECCYASRASLVHWLRRHARSRETVSCSLALGRETMGHCMPK